MPSPFPGMDPWLEQHWGDVHTRIVTYCSDRLQPSLPRDLRARVEERVELEFGDSNGGHHIRGVIPDARVVEYPHLGPAQEEGGVATLTECAPIIIEEPYEAVTERYVEIRDFSTGGRLITVIEVLSPTNKTRGASREKYLRKREEYREARVHLVEVDLLRGGEPLEQYPRTALKPEYHTPYLITVTRENSDNGRRYELYPAPLRKRLPAIAVPLRPGDEDVLLDVQALVNDAYDRGGYDILDYEQHPEPPLSDADWSWSRNLVGTTAKP